MPNSPASAIDRHAVLGIDTCAEQNDAVALTETFAVHPVSTVDIRTATRWARTVLAVFFAGVASVGLTLGPQVIQRARGFVADAAALFAVA